MVSLSIAHSSPVVVNGVSVTGPVTLEGETFSVLGQTLTSGAWLVGDLSGSASLVEIASIHPLLLLVSWPLAICLGTMAAFFGYRMFKWQ